MSRTMAHVRKCRACTWSKRCGAVETIAAEEFGSSIFWYAISQARKGVDVSIEPEAKAS